MEVAVGGQRVSIIIIVFGFANNPKKHAMPIVCCYCCGSPARSSNTCPCHRAPFCSLCFESHSDAQVIMEEGSGLFIILPSEITVDIVAMEMDDKKAARKFKKAVQGQSMDKDNKFTFVFMLAPSPLAAVYLCNECIDNKDGTYTLNNVKLVVVKRKTTDIHLESGFLKDVKESPFFVGEFTSTCLTESQGAGVALYQDVIAAMLYLGAKGGVELNCSFEKLMRCCMHLFSRLVRDSSASEMDKYRHIVMYQKAGSRSLFLRKDGEMIRALDVGPAPPPPGFDKVHKICVFCGDVGDFRQCVECKFGIYYCSSQCRTNDLQTHTPICESIRRIPVAMRTPQRLESMQFAMETTMFFSLSDSDADKLVKEQAGCILKRICVVCGLYGDLKCKVCKNSYYCSKICQKLAYPTHRRLYHQQI